MRSKGFSSVYVVIILASVVIFLLAVAELSASHAAGSIGENLCALAGSSLLSEYDKRLQKEYGVFALRSAEEELERLCRYYIDENLKVTGGLVRPELKKCRIYAEEYSGLDTGCLARQINVLGGMIQAEKCINEGSLGDFLSQFWGAGNQHSNPEEAETMLDEMADAPDPAYAEDGEEIPEDENSKERRRQAGDLVREYRRASNPSFDFEEGKNLDGIELALLPCNILGVGKTYSLLLSGGLMSFSPESLLQATYCVDIFSNYVNSIGDNILLGELEYMLYGFSSDKENMKRVKMSIFGLRSAVNLSENLADPKKMNEYAATAASAFPMIPAPVAVLMLAGIDGALEAKVQVETLLSGGKVPLLKSFPGAGKIFPGEYTDYLFVLMLMLPEHTRMARLMDIIQLNLSRDEGKGFSFRNYCYGFRLEAEFSKAVYMPLAMGVKSIYGYIEQDHGYK